MISVQFITEMDQILFIEKISSNISEKVQWLRGDPEDSKEGKVKGTDF